MLPSLLAKENYLVSRVIYKHRKMISSFSSPATALNIINALTPNPTLTRYQMDLL